MKLSCLVLGLQFGIAIMANAQDVLVDMPVYAKMDIYRAGGYDDGSDGIAPAVYTFESKANQILTFRSVTGQWTCRYGDTSYSADGSIAGDPCYSDLGTFFANPIGPFSGYATANFQGALVGMFLADSLPIYPPPALTFIRGNRTAPGQIPTRVEFIRPLIGQVFFIGDGLTGTAAGSHQDFVVPPLATHLYLAYADSCIAAGQPGGVPGCYDDNAGTLTAVFAIYSK